MQYVYRFEKQAAAPLTEDRMSSLALEYGELELRYYAPDGIDTQTPHDRDEVYFVVEGRGRFFCDGAREEFGPGDAIFVPAGAEHRFEEWVGKLAVWVVFYGPIGGSPKSD